ncbi:MAG TPA: hypothetical protein ENK91_15250, partial [Bacteroidetes bacterium]|nr:hypothetical protein [Bacteroidota bacterium]
MKTKVRKYRLIGKILKIGFFDIKFVVNKIKTIISDTPVLMANNPFRNVAPAMAITAMPIVAVPIQDVHLLDYAVANTTVNAGYGITASTDDTYMGLLGKDPYTSNQQRERDRYELNDKDWNEVVFEEVDGTSVAKLALYQDWIRKNNYQQDAIVELNLPEQGINGPFRITSIKHILPQKKPVDEDPDDDYDYKPVTALFIHHPDEVYNITFEGLSQRGLKKAETIGVTYQHPIFSVTAGDWRLAGELQVGEKVLTKSGESTVTSIEKKGGSEPVYNLEVKDLHIFLVGDVGVVVHNNYLSKFFKGVEGAKGLIGEDYEVWLRKLFPNARKVSPKDLVAWQHREYD